MATNQAPVLMIGGSGIVGQRTARVLRQLRPNLPLVIGGRNLTNAQTIATQLGNTHATRIDLEQPTLGLPEHTTYSAIVVFFKDDTLQTMRYAQQRAVPYVSLSSGTFEIGPEVAQYVHVPNAAPILMASQWLAGAATLPTLHFAKAYSRVDIIRIGLLLDEHDMGGPAAAADYDRIIGTLPAALTLKDGLFT